MRRVWICVITIGAALVSVSMAGAFTVPPAAIDDGTEGEVRLLWTQPVDPADVGKTCEVAVVTTNIESTRDGSDLIVASGGTTVVAENVEADTSPQTVLGQLTLGATVTVSVRFGPEGMYSGGSSVETTCPPTVVPTPAVAPSGADAAPAQAAAAASPAAAAVPARPRFTG